MEKVTLLSPWYARSCALRSEIFGAWVLVMMIAPAAKNHTPNLAAEFGVNKAQQTGVPQFTRRAS
jgi:hypothetical protein